MPGPSIATWLKCQSLLERERVKTTNHGGKEETRVGSSTGALEHKGSKGIPAPGRHYEEDQFILNGSIKGFLENKGR